jgi:hypothetical protein
MRIGFDVQFLLWSRGGIGSYLRHVYDSLCRLTPPVSVVPCVYGPPGFEEPEEVRQVEALSPRRKLHSYWDGPALPLLSRYFKADSAPAPWFTRKIDRRILLPLWVRQAKIETAYPKRRHWLTRFWRPWSSENIDLYHHTGPIVLPPRRFRANVLTVYDLGTFRVPQFHMQDNSELWQDTFDLAP